MKFLSQNSKNKKVYNNNKTGTISNKSYITVNALGKTWRVKKEVENKWLKVAKVKEFLRNNFNDVLGAVSVAIASILMYCIIATYY
ncbi:hypothetical protein [Clostridium botulinum]